MYYSRKLQEELAGRCWSFTSSTYYGKPSPQYMEELLHIMWHISSTLCGKGKMSASSG